MNISGQRPDSTRNMIGSARQPPRADSSPVTPLHPGLGVCLVPRLLIMTCRPGTTTKNMPVATTAVANVFRRSTVVWLAKIRLQVYFTVSRTMNRTSTSSAGCLVSFDPYSWLQISYFSASDVVETRTVV